MIQVITKHSLNDIFAYPEDYVDSYDDLELVKIVDGGSTTIIMIGQDEISGEYYFVVEDDEVSEDIYFCSMNMTLSETFNYICSEVQNNQHDK